ncbi:unnamed protein product [Gongylonema pulchrum]|uniref:Response regulatory domain-containing protein n=1 Tax=Gongylonema pulchrum TaxID=637853 RepID=A0A183EHS7_9BILA|nr:unnamed protein product [Gongylonema pulchrum]
MDAPMSGIQSYVGNSAKNGLSGELNLPERSVSMIVIGSTATRDSNFVPSNVIGNNRRVCPAVIVTSASPEKHQSEPLEVDVLSSPTPKIDQEIDENNENVSLLRMDEEADEEL